MRILKKAAITLSETNRRWLAQEREGHSRELGKRGWFERTVLGFFGIIAFLLGAVGVFDGVSRPDLMGFIFGLLFTLAGAVLISPKLSHRIYAPFKWLWKHLVSPLKKAFARIMPENGADDIFENKIFQFILFCTFAVAAWNGAIEEESTKQLLLYASALVFSVAALYTLFPNVIQTIGIVLLWLVGTGVAIWIIYVAAENAGPIPVSIIVGALIIASAIKSKGST